MRATVTYNEDGEPFRFEVSDRYGYQVTFELEGSTAVATLLDSEGCGEEVYLEQLTACLNYAETLPFVQAAELAPEPEVES